MSRACDGRWSTEGARGPSLRKCVLLGRALGEESHSLGPALASALAPSASFISSLGLYFPLCKMELITPAPPCLWEVAETKPV